VPVSIAELECADDIVRESYECTFNDLSTHPIRPDELRRQVIENNLLRFDTIVVLGGRNYSDRIKMAFSGKNIVTPLAGITGIGYMIQDLGNAIKNGKPLGERLSDQNYFPFSSFGLGVNLSTRVSVHTQEVQSEPRHCPCMGVSQR